MAINIGKEVSALKRMTVGELRKRYAKVFNEETKARNKAWLIKRIAWRLQSLEEGDISDRARQRAAELANDADVRMSPPKAKPRSESSDDQLVATNFQTTDDNRLPPAGSVLVREYKGQKIQVRVLPKGFEYEGVVYKSLTAVAKAITGQHCSGYRFFRLNKKGRDG